MKLRAMCSFFFRAVTSQANNLHPVLEWAGDWVELVGGGDEHCLGQVKGDIQIMILEGKVLLGIQYFQ